MKKIIKFAQDYFKSRNNEPANIEMILKYINLKWKHGACKNSLSSTIGKNKLIFEKAGVEIVDQRLFETGKPIGKYTRSLWRLKI